MKETLEEAAEKWYDSTEENKGFPKMKAFKEGAKWQKNNCVQFINKLENESFNGWSEEAISGYLTACITIKQKEII